jgi:hypothetical protein
MPSPVCIVGATGALGYGLALLPRSARIVETLTSLLISINVRNKVGAGIRITGLPE